MTRPKNDGLAYLRRSTDKQEISLPRQISWSIDAALADGVRLDAGASDLDHMQSLRLHSYKGIRLDDGITGSDLTRPGFLAFNRDALKDPSISHLYFYKRDRFARPTDAMQAVAFEKELLWAGITVVHSDGVSTPMKRNEQNLLRDIEWLFAYYQGGEELRKHAERVIGAQLELAKGGFRVGGNAPYGCVHVLVDASGKILEELPPGKTVRQPGCHVRVIPKDPVKIGIWLQILEWKAMGWGTKRIARELNDRNIPSPDAGRTRTDHGVKHRVTGKWSPNTIGELCHNATILGLNEYGKRSEGKIRRLGDKGPRLLDEQKDLTESGGVRVIMNDPSLRVTKQVGEALFDRAKWEQIQQDMEARGKSQRGVPRAKDPARYPLACRIVDLTAGCGSILYGRHNHGRGVYTCGRYMRTAGHECFSNQIDAEAILRFTLKTFKQFVDLDGRREKLREKLFLRAQRAEGGSASNRHATDTARLSNRRTELLLEKETIEYRMARERDDALYEVLTRQFRANQAEFEKADTAMRQLESNHAEAEARGPDAEVAAAMTLLDDISRITGDTAAREEINPLLQRLGLRIGLLFGTTIKGQKREVQRLMSGRMVFGDTPLPVALFGKDNVEGPGNLPVPTVRSTDEKNPENRDDQLAGDRTDNDLIDERSRSENAIAEAGVVPAPAISKRDLVW